MMRTSDALSAAGAVRHGFFTREGGVSEGIYASLNCGFGSDDDKARVAANRARAMAALGVAPEALVNGYQVHGADVFAVGDAPPATPPRADALVTRTPGVALAILTADCAPVLFADPDARVVGAAHAGWRGAIGGVLDAAVAAMERLGAARGHVVAAVGPCIAQRSYQVGPEFPVPFLDEDPANARFFAADPEGGRFRFDLEGYVVARLERIGVAAVHAANTDTCPDDMPYFSYRRSCQLGEPDYGRHLSAIALMD
jgi:YfiH family protein